MFRVERRLSSEEVGIFYQMQLSTVLFTSTSMNLTNLGLTDHFLVQLCGYIDYLITGDDPSLRRLYLNSTLAF